MKILIINGANLGVLGRRETEIYGDKNWETIWYELSSITRNLNIQLEHFQSNHEGAIIDKIWEEDCPLIINAGAFAHTSIALRDAIHAKKKPTIEVHLTNTYAREQFRRTSYISEVATGVVVGLGAVGYKLAIMALHDMLGERCEPEEA